MRKGASLPLGSLLERGEGRMDWEFEISGCRLSYVRWIHNNILLQSTGNYIQYPVINNNGKQYEKEYIYVNQPHFNKINFFKNLTHLKEIEISSGGPRCPFCLHTIGRTESSWGKLRNVLTVHHPPKKSPIFKEKGMWILKVNQQSLLQPGIGRV